MLQPETKKIRVLIVDDHPAVREGLGLWVGRQADMAVCGEAEDVGDALKLVAALDPDVVVVDISLKTGNGIDLIKRIKTRNDRVRLLVWSMHNENLYAERALRAGALGYVSKDQATEKIIEAIRRVRDGKIYLSEKMAEQLLTRTVGQGEGVTNRTPVEGLSDRELQVFQLLGSGLDTHQIAERMNISNKTVETYRTRIKEKLKLSNSTELLQRAVQWELEQKG